MKNLLKTILFIGMVFGVNGDSSTNPGHSFPPVDLTNNVKRAVRDNNHPLYRELITIAHRSTEIEIDESSLLPGMNDRITRARKAENEDELMQWFREYRKICKDHPDGLNRLHLKEKDIAALLIAAAKLEDEATIRELMAYKEREKKYDRLATQAMQREIDRKCQKDPHCLECMEVLAALSWYVQTLRNSTRDSELAEDINLEPLPLLNTDDTQIEDKQADEVNEEK
jgi:hypothetical protein